jgi:hypothetical protein
MKKNHMVKNCNFVRESKARGTSGSLLLSHMNIVSYFRDKRLAASSNYNVVLLENQHPMSPKELIYSIYNLSDEKEGILGFDPVG